jgi:hypothetical protein
MVFELSIFASDSIAKLLQAFGADAKLGSNRLLGRVVCKKDVGSQRCIWVRLLVDAPKNVVEQWL